MSRKVIIYNTIGDNFKEIYTDARTWGALTDEFNTHGVTWKGMKAVDGETQHSFESSEAILPEGEFSLFLMHDKVKSGYSDGDDDLIDEYDGITWDEEPWDNDYNNPEDFSFRTRNDLMMARAKKASHYLNKVMDFISNERSNKTAAPRKENSLVNTMREQAEKLRKNLGNIND
jgi:hypothetical protein